MGGLKIIRKTKPKKSLFLLGIIISIIILVIFILFFKLETHSITIDGKELVEKIGLHNSSLKNISGKNVTVALIDTGICMDNYKNTSRIKIFKDFINSNIIPYDDNGHGTKIATIIGGNKDTKGITANCNFVVIKAFDYEGESNIDILIKSLEWVIENHEIYNINLINMSLGIETLNSPKHDKLAEIINEIDKLGIILVAASGNGETNKPVMTPSNHAVVLCVGSIKEKADGILGVCSFTRGATYTENRNKPDIYTYGSNIAFWRKGNGMADMVSGTSYSAAIISGIVCLLIENNQYYSNNEIKNTLINENSIVINGMHLLHIKK